MLSAVSAGARHLKLRWRGSAAFANAAASRSLAEKVKFKAGETLRDISLSLFDLSRVSLPTSQSNVHRIGAGGEHLCNPSLLLYAQPASLERCNKHRDRLLTEFKSRFPFSRGLYPDWFKIDLDVSITKKEISTWRTEVTRIVPSNSYRSDNILDRPERVLQPLNSRDLSQRPTLLRDNYS